MRASILAFGAFAGLASANINFNWVNPTCDINAPDRCLTGQHCGGDNKCIADIKSDHSKISSSHLQVVPEKRQTTYSQDGQCGPAHNNLLCDPNSTVYSGSCCSQYGWCGSTAAHCGTGCLSGCGNTPSTPVASTAATVPARDDGRCGKDFGGASCDAKGAYGGCCSSYGYCGSTDGHCLVANGCQNGCQDATTTKAAATSAAVSRPPSTTTSGEPVLGKPTSVQSTPATPTGVQTTDGSCGATFKDTVCGSWAQGMSAT